MEIIRKVEVLDGNVERAFRELVGAIKELDSIYYYRINRNKVKKWVNSLYAIQEGMEGFAGEISKLWLIGTEQYMELGGEAFGNAEFEIHLDGFPMDGFQDSALAIREALEELKERAKRLPSIKHNMLFMALEKPDGISFNISYSTERKRYDMGVFSVMAFIWNDKADIRIILPRTISLFDYMEMVDKKHKVEEIRKEWERNLAVLRGDKI